MSRRRLALIAGAVVLLGGVFTLTFSYPQVFLLVGGGQAAAGSRERAGEVATSILPTVTPAELKEKLDRGEAVLIADVRGAKSFKSRHIAGAMSMPASEMDTWGPKLDPETLTVFYCSCPDDHSSTATAEMVQDKYGYSNLAILHGGLRAWEDAGYPMSVDDAETP